MKKIDKNSELYKILITAREGILRKRDLSVSTVQSIIYGDNGTVYYIYSVLEDYEEMELVGVFNLNKDLRNQTMFDNAFIVFGDNIEEISFDLFVNEATKQIQLANLRNGSLDSLEISSQIEDLKSKETKIEPITANLYKSSPFSSDDIFLRNYITFCTNLSFTRKSRDLARREFENELRVYNRFSKDYKKDGEANE